MSDRLTPNESDVGRNQLTGSVASEIGSLSSLTVLSSFRNRLSGSLADALTLLANLTILNFGNNQFDGTISSTIGPSWLRLRVLRVRIQILVFKKKKVD